MAEDFDQKLIEFTAILDEFSAGQRAAALNESRRQRLTMVRTLGDAGMQISFEAVIDETTDAGEIYETLARVDAACNRFKAQASLSEHLHQILNLCGACELSSLRLHDERVGYERKHADANARRSGRGLPEIGLTDQQKTALDGIRKQIKDSLDKIDDHLAAAEECRRIIGGTDPFDVLSDEVRRRVDALRGSREAA